MKRLLAITLLSILRRTWRLRVSGRIPTKGVVAFWHGQMLPVWALFANRQAVALVSQSRDGELLAALLEHWGYHCIRGSSSRGGSEALAVLIEQARSGKLVLITPDGPRGPRGVVKRGAIVCAQQANVPLIWCSVQCSWAWHSRHSWDRFCVPLPFARVELSLSDAIEVPPQEDAVVRLSQMLQVCYAPRD